MTLDTKQASKAGVKSYRYIRFISTHNDEYAVKCKREEADVVGEYVTNDKGFPMHVADLDIAEAESLVDPATIEKLEL